MCKGDLRVRAYRRVFELVHGSLSSLKSLGATKRRKGQKQHLYIHYTVHHTQLRAHTRSQKDMFRDKTRAIAKRHVSRQDTCDACEKTRHSMEVACALITPTRSRK
jgi:glutamate synthase domain-containing protein 2